MTEVPARINQPFTLTDARYKLNIQEQRVLLRILEELQPEIGTRIRRF
jgi:hypothetical protein